MGLGDNSHLAAEVEMKPGRIAQPFGKETFQFSIRGLAMNLTATLFSSTSSSSIRELLVLITIVVLAGSRLSISCSKFSSQQSSGHRICFGISLCNSLTATGFV